MSSAASRVAASARSRAEQGWSIVSANAGDLRKRFELGETFGADRRLYDVLGYTKDLDYDDFKRKYERNGVAGALIDRPIEKSWRERPTISDDLEEDERGEDDTDFERAVEYLFDEYRLLHYLERVDKAAALGRYAVLYIGFQDGVTPSELDSAVEESALSELDPDADYTESNPPPVTHFGVFSEAHLDDDPKLDTDPTSPRHNLPVQYRIDYGAETGDAGRTYETHWSRVIHVAHNLLESEWEGRPELKRLFNRIEDWDKVVGGVAEVAWRSADRKIIFNLDPDMGDIEDEEDLEAQIEDVIHDLENYLQTRGMEVTTIEGEVQDPSGIVGVLKDEYGADGMPQRVLFGSERGELASSQDESNFLGSVGERQEQTNEPAILRPTLDRLINTGVLPEPSGGSYTIEWPNLFELTELEEAEKTLNLARALKAASPMGDPGTVLDDEGIMLFIDAPDDIVERVKEAMGDEGALPPGEVPPPEEGGPGAGPPGESPDDGEEPPEEEPPDAEAGRPGAFLTGDGGD